MFKEKTTKKRIHLTENSKDTATLDARHQDMIERLAADQKSISDIEANQEDIISEISRISCDIAKMKRDGQFDTKDYESMWCSNMKLQEQLKANTDYIAELVSGKHEIDYYETTGYTLFKYYDIIEKQNTAPSDAFATNMPTVSATAKTKNRKKMSQVCPAHRSILEAFRLNSTTSNVVPGTPPAAKHDDKSYLVDEYLACVDSGHLRASATTNEVGMCPKCNLPLVCLQQDGVIVCFDCGYQEILLIEQNRPLLRNTAKDSTSHASYKRINHFREWCSQVQGKESTDIPEEIFEQILNEIKKEKITDTKKITYNKMREILKRLRSNKFYEHIHYIINRINGVPPPHFTPEVEDKLCAMFKEIQGPFLRNCPAVRKNFLSYSYVLHKFFQLLDMHEYLKWFQLLKSKSKLYLQDQIFKAICEELGWDFHPSL